MLIGLPPLAADWAEKDTFRRFVESFGIKPVELNWNDSGGVAYDPGRTAAKLTQQPPIGAEWADKNLYKIAKQIHELTEVPMLTPEKYRNLIASISGDVAETQFHLLETGKRVRDRCRCRCRCRCNRVSGESWQCVSRLAWPQLARSRFRRKPERRSHISSVSVSITNIAISESRSPRRLRSLMLALPIMAKRSSTTISLL